MTRRRPPDGCGGRISSPSWSAALRRPSHSRRLQPRRSRRIEVGRRAALFPFPPPLWGRDTAAASSFQNRYVARTDSNGPTGATMLRIMRDLLIDENDIEIGFVRASGPGG